MTIATSSHSPVSPSQRYVSLRNPSRGQFAMDGKEKNKEALESGQQALDANNEHSDALKTHIQRLEAELKKLDKLVVGLLVFFQGFWRT